MSKIDVIIPYSQKKALGKELELCVKSIIEFMGDLGKIYIIGDQPSFVTTENVVHVEAHDIYQHCKDANIINKCLLGCLHPDCSNQVVIWSDDQVAMKEFNAADVFDLPIRVAEYDINTVKSFMRTAASSLWYSRLLKTLQRFGYGATFPEPHCPVLVDRDTFIEIMINSRHENQDDCIIYPLYFNSIPNQRYKQNTGWYYHSKGGQWNNSENPTIVGYNDKSYPIILKKMKRLIDV